MCGVCCRRWGWNRDCALLTPQTPIHYLCYHNQRYSLLSVWHLPGACISPRVFPATLEEMEALDLGQGCWGSVHPNPIPGSLGPPTHPAAMPALAQCCQPAGGGPRVPRDRGRSHVPCKGPLAVLWDQWWPLEVSVMS